MEIYAEIDKKKLHSIEILGNSMVIPNGVKMSRRNGSRACYFECDSGYKDDLIDFLDNNRISWQYTSNEKENNSKKIKNEINWKSESKYEKNVERKNIFKNIKDIWDL